ncbi:ABC transporter substrate-binding protein [Gordonibacter pamelaeae]|uniref:ABC transporter substrate-binding protein n=1 Tax=Gordonibacter pamelaeae TaxID=471189 RepID=UPI002FE1E41A
MNVRKIISSLMAGALLLGLTACSPSAAEQETRPDNEIVTYEPLDPNKTLITLGRYTVFNDAPLKAALEEKFPHIQIASVNAAGTNTVRAYVEKQGEHEDLPDLIFSGMRMGDSKYAYDFSAESFTSRYNLSSLEALDADGSLRQLPVNSAVKGIFYNKTLFEEHGWEIPATRDELFKLCEEISAEGIRPFVPCLKYSVQEVGLGLTNRELLGTSEKRAQYEAVVKGEASCEGLLEPYYSVLRELYDRGIVVEGDFTSSLTKNRQAMYAGEIAMIPAELGMYGLYEEENPDCEIDFIGYPTDTSGERWMQMVPGTNLAAPQRSMDGPDKKQILLDIVDYLSTDEGQDVLFQCFTGISGVKTCQENIRSEFWDVKNCLDKGQLYFADQFGQTSDFETAFDWMRGNMTMDEVIAATDEFEPLDPTAPEPSVAIGTAAEDFTALETSMLMADVMREAAGADAALLLHGTYYKGNSSKIYQGTIDIPDRFNLRSVSKDDALTTYEITGANLKKLMEHPLLNGEEVNALYAFSGLKAEYAPWRDEASNVLSLALADGTEIDDGKLYTVAAWAGTVDESYVSSTVKAHSELGTITDLMTAYLADAGEVSPAKDGRITLNWEQDAA